MHRNHLVRTANEIKGTIGVLNSNVSRGEAVGEPVSLRKSRVNPATMDVAFADHATTCYPEPVCRTVEAMFPFRPYQMEEKAGEYKYVFDIDGNGWSGRFKRLMTTNSLVFKSTIYPEW